MARTFTAAERNAITNAHNNIAARLELKDYDGDWTNVSTALGGGTLDWLDDITLEEDVDNHTMLLTGTLLRDNGSTQSLAPLRTDSTLNRDNSNNYQPFLDLARQWRVSVSVVAHGDAANWKEIGAGTYDVIDVQSPQPAVQIVGRDWGATLLDRYIEVERTYGVNESPTSMENVIQQILDDHIGAGAITLYTPTSPSFTMKEFTLVDMNVMEAINLVANKAGFVCRYRYDSADALRLTLYAPARTATAGSEVWTLGPSEYIGLPSARLDLSGIRNKIIVQYHDDATGYDLRTIRQNATSIARYGGPHAIPRTMLVDLSKDTHITTSTRANAFGDAVLSDLAVPPQEQRIETTGFWIAQLHDYGKFSANTIHYDTDQYGGVSRIEHRIADGTMRTILSVRGQPQGQYRRWLDNRVFPVGIAPLRILTFRETARSTTQVTFSWETEGVVEEHWLWLETQAQPVSSDPWPSLDTIPDFRLTAATTSYAVDIPVDGSVVYGVLVPVGANAAFGRPWQFTVQRTGMEAVPDAGLSISSTGAVTLTANGASWVLSHKWATSTSDFPSEATVLASGTTTNGRQMNVATGDTLSLGGAVFATVIPFSDAAAGGVQGSAIRLKAVRFDATATKTVLFSPGAATVAGASVTTIGIAKTVAATNVVQLSRTAALSSQDLANAVVDLQVPQGVTITSVSSDVYHDASASSGSRCKYSLSVIGSDGTATESLSGNSSTAIGWQTITTAGSLSSTGSHYQFIMQLRTGSSPDADVDNAYLKWARFSVTYTMPSTANQL